MKNLKLVNGDFVMDGQNNFVMVEGDDELLQELTLEFQENKGEYFLAPDIGFARYDVLGKKFDRERALDAAYEVLLRNPRIASVETLEVSFDRETRKATFNFKAIKTNGDTLAGEVVA